MTENNESDTLRERIGKEFEVNLVRVLAWFAIVLLLITLGAMWFMIGSGGTVSI